MLSVCTWESFIFSGSPLGSEHGDLEVFEAKLKTKGLFSGCKKELYLKKQTNKQTRTRYLTPRREMEMALEVGGEPEPGSWLEVSDFARPLPEAEGVLMCGCALIIRCLCTD